MHIVYPSCEDHGSVVNGVPDHSFPSKKVTSNFPWEDLEDHFPEKSRRAKLDFFPPQNTILVMAQNCFGIPMPVWDRNLRFNVFRWGELRVSCEVLGALAPKSRNKSLSR